MTDIDLSEARKFFSHDSVTVISFSNLLELKFLPRVVVERWISARTLGEISSSIEEALVVYSKLNSWQRNNARIDMPKALHHLLSTVHFSNDTTVLSVCMRFICLIFEDHSDMFSFCADIILLKILKHADDQRVAVRGAAVKCLGVFITNITFSALESSMQMILGNSNGADGENMVTEVRSENRLKLVTLALLSFNREIMTGVSTLTSSSQRVVVTLTHSIVCSIFESTDGGDCGKSYFSEMRVPLGNFTQEQLVMSAAIDLIAASSLILCPKACEADKSCFGSSLSSQDSLGRKTFPSEFVDVALCDSDGILRAGAQIQDEAHRRLAEKRLTSLNNDVDLSDMANLLLLYVDNDNPLLTLPPALHKSLLLYIPAFEPSDSLSTTAESSSNISGNVQSTNGTEISPLPFYSSSSNTNTPLLQFVLHDEGNASSSLDGITSDSDIDRTKLSALKKSQSRGGSRKQRRVGSTSQTSMVSMMSSDTPDFFATNRSEGEDSSDSRSPFSSSTSRMRPFFPTKSVTRDVDDADLLEGDTGFRRSSMRKGKDKDEFSEFSVLPIRGGSFYRTSRPIDTLVEGDGADIDADDNSDHDYEEEMFHDERDSEKADAEDYNVDISRGRRRNGEPLPDDDDMEDDSYLQGFGVRTAEERGRSLEMLDENHQPQRSKSIPYAPHPESGSSYRSNGLRTNSLSQSMGNQERVGKRSIAIAMSLARDNKQMASSQSVPCTHLSLDYQELKSGHLLALPAHSWSKGPASQEFPASRRQSSDSEWDVSVPCVQRHPSHDFGHPNVLLESLNSIGLSKKLRTLRSPTVTMHEHALHIAPSSSSPKPSSPLASRANTASSFSATKVDIRSKGRDRFFKGKEENSCQKDLMMEEEAAGHKEYQLTGETFEYLTTEAIMPSAAPQKDLAKALLGIGIQEWPEIFHTLTTVRRLSLHHSALVIASSSSINNGATSGAAGGGGNSGAGRGMHCIVVGVLKQVDNLRSAVAKNALLTLGDLFQGLGKFMDLEVALCLTHVLKRFADSSTFLVESAERALQQMMDGVTPSRSLTGLLTAAEHRAPTVRGKVASVLYQLWHQKLRELKSTCMSGGKEQEVLKYRVGKLVFDQSPEARAASRNLVRFLVKEGVVSKGEWEQVISADQLPKILSQSLTPPGAIGGGSNHRASKPLLFCSPTLSQEMSIDVSQESIFKSRTNGLSKNRHSSSGLARSPPTWSSPYIKEPNVGFSVNADVDDREFAKDKNKGKGDKGVSFAAADNDCDSCSYTVQSRKSVSQYSTGGTGLSKTLYSNDGSTKANRRKEMGASTAAKRSMETPELQVLPELIQTARSSTHWTERQETLKSITELVVVHWKVMLEALRLDLCVDCLLERLEDGSVKVVICALACLQRIHDEAPGALGHSPALQLVVVSALHGTASASNKQIASTAMSFLSLFISSVSIQLSVSHICAISLHEKDRQRVVAFKALADMLAVESNPQREELLAGGFIKKNIFPTICQVLFGSGSKGEVRVAAAEALRVLQQVMLSSNLSTFCRKRDSLSEKCKDRDTGKVAIEKNRDKYNCRLYSEKNKENDSESKLLWTWCRDTGQQEEIKRLTANSS